MSSRVPITEYTKNEKYQRGLVYGLVCNITGKLYIGSTINLEQRKKNHKSKGNTCMSKQIIDGGDYEFYVIELYPCWSVFELRIREEYHRQRNECVNKLRCYVSEEDRREYKRKFDRQYRKENKEILNEKQRQFWHDNKERLNEEQKVRRDNMTEEKKEEAKEYKAIWYQENKDKIREEAAKRYAEDEELQRITRERAAKWAEENSYDVICECRYVVKKRNLNTHLKSKAHERYMKNGPPLPVEERRKQCFDCDCGGKYQYSSKAAHFRSQRHIDYINSLKKPSEEEELLSAHRQKYQEVMAQLKRLKQEEIEEEKKEKRKQYKKEYKKERNSTILCECGGVYNTDQKQRHLRTDKHIEYENGDDEDYYECICGTKIKSKQKTSFERHFHSEIHKRLLKEKCITEPEDLIEKALEWLNGNNYEMCECGACYRASGKSYHLESTKHKEYLENKDKPIPKGKYKCECGQVLNISGKSRHLTRNEHAKRMELIKN